MMHSKSKLTLANKRHWKRYWVQVDCIVCNDTALCLVCDDRGMSSFVCIMKMVQTGYLRTLTDECMRIYNIVHLRKSGLQSYGKLLYSILWSFIVLVHGKTTPSTLCSFFNNRILNYCLALRDSVMSHATFVYSLLGVTNGRSHAPAHHLHRWEYSTECTRTP